MGLTIRAKKSPEKSVDLGAGGFLRLRQKVSQLAGEPWASHYAALLQRPFSASDAESFYAEFDTKTAELIAERKVSVKLVDFCLQSDIEGSIHYGACKLLSQIIGDYDDDILYGHAGRPDCARFQDFKAILQECAGKKCDLIWD